MVRKSGFRKDRVLLSLAVVGATLTGGIVSYSIAVASPAAPTVRSEMAVEGPGIDCNFPRPDLDWYRQRGDRMLSNQMLPNTVSFQSTSSGLRPAGDPCEDDGDGGGGGGGGGGSSCLSDFGFDPTDYWVVIEKLTTENYTAVDVFAATDGSLSALSGTDIDTTTGCTVSYEWAFVETGDPVSALLSFWGASGTGASSPLLEISGMSADGQNWGDLYFLYICGGSLGLKVSDGVNDYYIVAPPCSTYRFETTVYSVGAAYKFEYEDPWGRADVFDSFPEYAGDGTSQIGLTVLPSVRPNSPMTLTFRTTSNYTVTIGDTTSVNCAEPSLVVILNAVEKTAGSTWVDPSPAVERIYCVTEDLLP